ncbi:hypothetical protein V8D89_005011 [Ganoderma adspersum]
MGHDATAKVVSLAKKRKFVKLEAQNSALAAHIRAGLKKAAANDCPLYELTVEGVPPSPDELFPDEPFPEPSSSRRSSPESSSFDDSTSEPPSGSTTSTRRFIVGRPYFSSDALVGSCTKGYMAFDVRDPKKWVPCFLKDSWRPYIRGRTRTEHLVYEPFRRMNVKATDDIATFDGKRTGILIDWELSRVESELGDGNELVKPDRAGTWQFRSALSLQYPKKPYRRFDDIESFVHVFLYLVLRYHATYINCIEDLARGLFEQASLIGGVKVGGDAKLFMIRSGTVPFRVVSNKPLQARLSTLLQGCSPAKSRLDRRAMDRLYRPDRTPAAPRAPQSELSEFHSDSARPARVRRVRHMSSCDMSEAPDDEEVEKALNRPSTSSCEDQTHRVPTATKTATATTITADLCKVGGLLSSPRTPIGLLCDHSRDGGHLRDKGHDRFSESPGFVTKKRGRSRNACGAQFGSTDDNEGGSSSRPCVKRPKVEERSIVAHS